MFFFFLSVFDQISSTSKPRQTLAHSSPTTQGNTVSGGSKPATLETGAVVMVPLFVNAGEKVKVDTRTDQYLSRATTSNF